MWCGCQSPRFHPVDELHILTTVAKLKLTDAVELTVIRGRAFAYLTLYLGYGRRSGRFSEYFEFLGLRET